MGSVRGHPLLVEHLLTDVRESDPSMPARYDAERGYSVTPTGDRSWKASCRETRTSSEVQAERDDSDQDLGTRTTTFVQAEADDWQPSGIDRTETAIRGEHLDFDAWASTTTMTKVQNEAEDRD